MRPYQSDDSTGTLPGNGGRESGDSGVGPEESGGSRESVEAPRKRFISGLVLDRDLSPRASLGSVLIKQLAEALVAGATLPPVVVESKTSRLVDGFHRIEAHRRVYGREAMVEVVEREYENDGDLFVDAVRLNAGHGSRLASYDQLRCVAIAERLSIDSRRMAKALSVRPSYIGELRASRMGTELATRSPIPLKRTIEHMRGQSLTPAQMETNQKLGGHSQAYSINQLNLLAENDLLDLESLVVRNSLRRLLGNLEALDLPDEYE